MTQSGHVLLVERASAPGEGLLALPGGHVNPDETFEQAVIRELVEETEISDGHLRTDNKKNKPIPIPVLRSFIKKDQIFDNPGRSARARVVTRAFLFQLPQKERLYWVQGNDDARYATWHKLGSIDPTRMFEDHFHIINALTGAVS